LELFDVIKVDKIQIKIRNLQIAFDIFNFRIGTGLPPPGTLDDIATDFTAGIAVSACLNAFFPLSPLVSITMI
jgi:hypothetical protein